MYPVWIRPPAKCFSMTFYMIYQSIHWPLTICLWNGTVTERQCHRYFLKAFPEEAMPTWYELATEERLPRTGSTRPELLRLGLNSRRKKLRWACNILMENAKLCGEGRPRPHVNGCYSCISLHSIDNLNNWAFVVVRYDPMICCVLHARVHPAERHQPTPPPSL